MPGPFEKPETPDADEVVAVLTVGSRARQLFQLGVGDDMDKRRSSIWRAAERELRAGTLTQERAFMHIACSNALARYREELQEDITKAQRAADALHADQPSEDGAA